MCTKNNCRCRICVCMCVCLRCSPTYISCIPIDKICIWLFGDIAFLWFICGTPKIWLYSIVVGALWVYMLLISVVWSRPWFAASCATCSMWHVWQRELIQFTIWPSGLANHRHPFGAARWGLWGSVGTVSKLVWLCHKNTCGLLISYFCGSRRHK